MPVGFDEILPTIVKNFANLLPIRVINQNDRGVRYFWGKPRPQKQLEPGVYLFLPLLGKIEIIGAIDGDIDLGTISVDTNSHSVSASASLVYRVVDAYKYDINLDDEDAKKTIRVIARGELSGALSRDYEAFRNNRASALEGLRHKLDEETRELYGVAIKRVCLHDFVTNPLVVRTMGESGAVKP